MKKNFFTTPIFYVNDAIHIGHAYTIIICDTLAKFFNLDEYDVLFTIGTDEHGLKVEKAQKKIIQIQKCLLIKSSENFLNLSKKLKISNTDFVRTTEERHKKSSKIFLEAFRRKKSNLS